MKRTKTKILMRPLVVGRFYKIDYSEYKCVKAKFAGGIKTATGIFMYRFVPDGWKCELFLTENQLKLVVAELEF